MREITLLQPHHTAAAQVDRGQDLKWHCHHLFIMLS
jgi:hypothetical protein